MLKRVFNTDADRRRKTSELPVGSVMAWHSATPPSALWLLCDGSVVAKSTNLRLYNLITANGTLEPYGPDTDSNGNVITPRTNATHFRLPDMRNRFLMSPDLVFGSNPGPSYVGSTGGSETHQHNFTTADGPVGGVSTTAFNTHTHTYNAGSFQSGGVHNHGAANDSTSGNYVGSNPTPNGYYSIAGGLGCAFEHHNHSVSYNVSSGGAHTHSLYFGLPSVNVGNNITVNQDTSLTSTSNHTHTVPYTGSTELSTAVSHVPSHVRAHFIVYSGGA